LSEINQGGFIMKRFLNTAMSCVLGTSVLAAAAGTAAAMEAQQQDNGALAKKKELRLNFHSEPFAADPGIADDSLSFTLLRATFEGLTRTGADGRIQPSAAEKIDVSDDLKTYTFQLRNAKWSNGDPVTAYDFEYAWKRVLDPSTAASYSFQLYVIKNAEKANRGRRVWTKWAFRRWMPKRSRSLLRRRLRIF